MEKQQLIDDLLEKVSEGSNNPDEFKTSPCALQITKAMHELLDKIL